MNDALGIEAIFPQYLPVNPDKETRAIFLSPDEELLVSNRNDNADTLVAGFHQVNEAYTGSDPMKDERLARLQLMWKSLGELPTGGRTIDFALRSDERNDQSNHAALFFSPVNDRKPRSTAEVLFERIIRPRNPTAADIRAAQPNSNSPLVKLDIAYEFMQTQGLNMPVMQIFARDAPYLTHSERQRIRKGDMEPYGRLGDALLKRVNETRDVPITHLHLFTAGLGGKALGAAMALQKAGDFEVASVTTQNLPMSDLNSAEQLATHMGRKTIDKDIEYSLPNGVIPILEPLMRRQSDKTRPEKMMYVRDGQSWVFNPWVLRALMKGKKYEDYIGQLLENGTTVTVANASNEPAIQAAEQRTPLGQHPNFHYIEIVGVDGKQTGQAANEHANVVAVTSATGIANHFEDQQRAA